jgi:hypothetical protein
MQLHVHILLAQTLRQKRQRVLMQLSCSAHFPWLFIQRTAFFQLLTRSQHQQLPSDSEMVRLPGMRQNEFGHRP